MFAKKCKMLLDIELVQNIKNNIDTEESIKGLINYHAPLLNKIAYKYVIPLFNSGSNIEEILKEKEYIIYKAALTFKEEKGVKFSSYLGSFVRWYCLNKINRSEDWKHIIDFPLESIVADQPIDEITLEYVKSLLNNFTNKKTKKVFELRYFSGSKLMSWDKVGKMMGGISGQTANNWYKRGLKLLSSRVLSDLK